MKNKILNRAKNVILSSAALLISLSLFSFTPVNAIKKDSVSNNFKLRTVVIDAGHGVKPINPPKGHYSPGASGSYSYERDVTLAIALKLQAAIQKDMSGVKAVLTRSTPEDVSFEHRAEIANQNKGNLFISIHCNSLSDRTIRERVGTKRGRAIYRTVRVPDQSGKGVLMLVYDLKRSREAENEIKNNQVESEAGLDGDGLDPDDPTVIILTNEYKRKFRKQSIKIANFINDEIVQTDGRRSEGIRGQSIYVLCHSAMPSVLVETGYINNPDDEKYLNSEEGQNEIVDSIIRAVSNYRKEIEQVSTN